METILHTLKKIIPKKLFEKLQPEYHYSLAFLGAVIYRFPSRKIKVIFITGTKGKSSTTEILADILEAGGKKVARAGTIRFKIGEKSWPNKYKMSVPGRMFIQKFLRQAVNAQCEYAVLEMTSEATRQFRHMFIAPNALLFLNISPEHIESHGSFENYLKAKVSLAHALEKSNKKNKVLIVNKDDTHSVHFEAVAPSAHYIAFSLQDAQPYTLKPDGLSMTYNGKMLHAHLQGEFNVANILAALSYATTEHISLESIQKALNNLTGIAGRVQKITLPSHSSHALKQDFEVVVDYAHTADSLQKFYKVFEGKKKICVLGNTGGGRDTWKRPEMARVANDNCEHIILTNEDPYDEDPMKIINEMLPGITTTPHEVIMNRRKAIYKAISLAKTGDAVLITGKGTDPYIMEANNTKTPWSDAQVAEEELEKVLHA